MCTCVLVKGEASGKSATLVKTLKKNKGGKKNQRGAADVERRHFTSIEQIKRKLHKEADVEKHNQKIRKNLERRVINDQLAQIVSTNHSQLNQTYEEVANYTAS